MRALLDVNVLTAPLDAAHLSHQVAMEWFAAHQFDTDDASVRDSLHINTSAVLNGRHLIVL